MIGTKNNRYYACLLGQKPFHKPFKKRRNSFYYLVETSTTRVKVVQERLKVVKELPCFFIHRVKQPNLETARQFQSLHFLWLSWIAFILSVCALNNESNLSWLERNTLRYVIAVVLRLFISNFLNCHYALIR